MNNEISTLNHDRTKLGLTSNALKYIAIIAMVIDHTAIAFFANYPTFFIILRFIGRIAGPIMFFAAAEGYHRTGNINKYMVRLAVFALISYFPFIYFDSGGLLTELSFSKLNVIYTILLGVLAIHVRRELKNPILKIVLVIVLIICSIPADWGVTGILIILTFDWFYGDFKSQAFCYGLIVLLTFGIMSFITRTITELIRTHTLLMDVNTNVLINIGLVIPIVLLYFYNSRKGNGGKFNKWFFYIFYPLHLLILGFLQGLLK